MEHYISFCKGFAIIFLLALVFGSLQVVAQSPAQMLQQADSLYDKGRKNAAVTIYKNLLARHNYYSGRALLRTAALLEANGQPAQALYYLHTYYRVHPASAIKRKIQELAEINELSGHQIGEIEFLLFQYRRFYIFIVAIPILLVFIVVANVVRTIIYKLPLVYNPVFFSTFVLLAFLAINLKSIYRHGIIVQGPVMLMSEPGAGSSLQVRLNEGHKVLVREHTDAWYRIDWQGQDAYISEKHLLLLQN